MAPTPQSDGRNFRTKKKHTQPILVFGPEYPDKVKSTT